MFRFVHLFWFLCLQVLWMPLSVGCHPQVENSGDTQRLGAEAYSRGELDLTEKHWLAGLATSEEPSWFAINLGILLMKQQRLGEAKRWFEAVLQEGRPETLTPILQAQLLYHLGTCELYLSTDKHGLWQANTYLTELLEMPNLDDRTRIDGAHNLEVAKLRLWRLTQPLNQTTEGPRSDRPTEDLLRNSGNSEGNSKPEIAKNPRQAGGATDQQSKIEQTPGTTNQEPIPTERTTPGAGQGAVVSEVFSGAYSQNEARSMLIKIRQRLQSEREQRTKQIDPPLRVPSRDW